MTLTPLFTLCLGLAFFLYGTNTLSAALRHMTGSRLKTTLRNVSSGGFRGLLLGAGITVFLQSSSALTVLLVRMVDAEILELRQIIRVIMGSNVGTTLTPWLLTLTGIEADRLSLLQPQNLSALLALWGALLVTASSRPSRQNTGHMMVGISLLLRGMDLMVQSASPLAETRFLSFWLSACQAPLPGLLAGTIFTAVIQSSAASIGILQALALAQPISYASAIPIIMGQNIGTCVTAWLSSAGASRQARRVAVVHSSFNLIGSLCVLAFLSAARAFFHPSILNTPISPLGIALCHTLFNLATTLLLLPFPSQLETLATILVPNPPHTPRAQSHGSSVWL